MSLWWKTAALAAIKIPPSRGASPLSIEQVQWDPRPTRLVLEHALDGTVGLPRVRQARSLEARGDRDGPPHFANYAKEDVTLTLGEVNGRVVLGVFRRAAGAPAYVIQLDVGPDGVRVIRDYRYVPYLGASLDFRPLA